MNQPVEGPSYGRPLALADVKPTCTLSHCPCAFQFHGGLFCLLAYVCLLLKHFNIHMCVHMNPYTHFNFLLFFIDLGIAKKSSNIDPSLDNEFSEFSIERKIEFIRHKRTK